MNQPGSLYMAPGNQQAPASTCSTVYARQVGEAWKVTGLRNQFLRPGTQRTFGPTRLPLSGRSCREMVPHRGFNLAPTVSIRSG